MLSSAIRSRNGQKCLCDDGKVLANMSLEYRTVFQCRAYPGRNDPEKVPSEASCHSQAHVDSENKDSGSDQCERPGNAH